MLEVDFSSLSDEMTRRAGVITDKSFFEIQMSANAPSAGNVQLFPGKPIDPMNSLISVQNNKFEVDFVDNKSKQLSQNGKVNLQLNFKYVLLKFTPGPPPDYPSLPQIYPKLTPVYIQVISSSFQAYPEVYSLLTPSVPLTRVPTF